MECSKAQLYQGSTVAELYRSAFKSFKHREALVSDDVRLSYQALEARVHQCARFLQDLGLRRQDSIAILAGNSADALIVLIAAQYLGLRSTALHPLGALQDHAFVLRDANVQALVVDGDNFAARGKALAELGIATHVLTLGAACDYGMNLSEAALDFSTADLAIQAEPDDISKISYTGGTTGTPKGVLQRQRTVISMTLLQLSSWEWPTDIRFLATTPISHAAGSCILPVFLRGGTVFFMKKFDVVDFMKRVQDHKITATFLVPTQIYGLLDAPELADHDLSSLQALLYGAAPMAASRLAEGIEKLGPVFCQLYGQAEAPMTLTYLRKSDHDLARPHLLSSCGQALPGIQVRLLGANGEPVATNEVGELCARGPLLMDGYLNRREETAQAFEGGWLHTGDLARMDEDGYLYLVDRRKDMIITGGFNVYSSEVENCLAQHPAVAASAVIGTPDPKWGEAVTAIVVPKPGVQIDADSLVEFVVEHKGVIHAPKRVFIESELPMTAIGKIDKKSLRVKYGKADLSLAPAG